MLRVNIDSEAKAFIQAKKRGVLVIDVHRSGG